MSIPYKRILVKISGEALAGEKGHGIDFERTKTIAGYIGKCVDCGVQVTIVIGAGNFWRGAQGTGMDRTRADHMGMLATMINCLGLQDALLQEGREARVLSAVSMDKFAETYSRDLAVRYLNEGKVVIFGCGTGNPFFTTDTAAVLRAIEVNADICLLAKNVNGIYEADPKTHPELKPLKEISSKEVLLKELKVIDSTAAALSKDNNLPVLLFELGDGENIYRAVTGETVGTVMTSKKG